MTSALPPAACRAVVAARRRVAAMKTFVAAASAVAVALLTIGCHDLYEADPLQTARADSSAAGYRVGESAADPDAPATLASHEASTAPERHSRPVDAPTRTTVAQAVTPADSMRRGTSAASQSDAVPGERTRSAGMPPSDTTLGVHAAAVPVDDSVVVSSFLSFNPAARTVWLTLIAGLDGENGALNFNGGYDGAHALVVPLGWRVELRFQNQDRELSHSAIVVSAVDPIPMLAPPAAFPNAFTLSLEEGLIEGRSDVVRFGADREGRYAILCAVPGHGQSGMWMRLTVTRNASVPEYRRR